jgi:SAM-dependent methyltransferase
MSATYRDVDRSPDPVEAAAWMDRVAAMPGVAGCKARSVALLAGAGRVLDLGCGPGDDVRRLPPGSVGIDLSATMLDVARARGGCFVRGGGHHLPFVDGAFGGGRAERVLQHVDAPEAVTAELVRVVAAGGPVVVMDPDQATLRIDGPDPDLTAEMVDVRRASLRNGFLAGRMAEVLAGAGCDEVAQERYPIVLDDPADAFGITTWGAMLAERGLWSEADAARFDGSLVAAAADGRFRYEHDLVLTRGTVR